MLRASSEPGESRPAAGPPGTAELLIVDDDPNIHEDFRRALGPRESSRVTRLDGLRSALFGGEAKEPAARKTSFALTHADQGERALALVQERAALGLRFSVAFVDMRMPPGWNGIETVRALRGVDPDILVVMCTAYSDFTWDEVLAGVGNGHGVHLLRKPFDPQQVRRYAEVLAHKWALARRSRP